MRREPLRLIILGGGLIGPLSIDGHAVQDEGGAARSHRRMIGRPASCKIP